MSSFFIIAFFFISQCKEIEKFILFIKQKSKCWDVGDSVVVVAYFQESLVCMVSLMLDAIGTDYPAFSNYRQYLI